tara:strand:- start:13842 stop:14309 length:468 start_codon:yes stop_codon:yes gene_type:complete
MLSFFFYGTLMDQDLRAAVFGGPCASVRPAVLKGYRRRRVAGETYPALAPARHSHVDGLLIAGVSPAMAARTSVYEGDQYDAVSLAVTTTYGAACDAWTFLPQAHVRLSTHDWSLDTWQQQHKSRALASARTFLSTDPAGGLRRAETVWQTRRQR